MKRSTTQVLISAAFLMASSSIGPGFLTQTAVFTDKLLASFGFVILISVLLDICVQLNIWRIIAAAERRAQDIANDLFPGLGYLLAFLIVLGGVAFNIGNIAGAGLGLNVLFGFDTATGAILSCMLAIGIFIVRNAWKTMDNSMKILGLVKIGLTLFVAWKSHPPMALVLKEAVMPSRIDFTAILTIVGGTVGGYITFAGAHRLMDAGVKGKDSIPEVSRSAVTAIGLSTIMRIFLFVAALGVIMAGGLLDKGNPAASVFRLAAGEVGYKLFGVVLWCAAISSIIGSAYTSVSFIKSFHPAFEKYYRHTIICFILFSLSIFLIVGRPVKVLVMAGALNGLILPIAMIIMLLAANNRRILPAYNHPKWLTFLGIVVIIAMGLIGGKSIIDAF